MLLDVCFDYFGIINYGNPLSSFMVDSEKILTGASSNFLYFLIFSSVLLSPVIRDLISSKIRSL